jgi:hypothetical protein
LGGKKDNRGDKGGEVDKYWLCPRTYAIINPVSAKLNKKEPKVAEKPLLDLKTFIENINRKDKLNGLKIRFGFTKRKR